MFRLFDALSTLLRGDNEGCAGNLNVALESNIKLACLKLNIKHVDVVHLNKDLTYLNDDDFSASWRFIGLAFHILLSVDKDADISVSQSRNIKACFQYIVSLGLLPNLIPGVGTGLVSKTKGDTRLNECTNPIKQYKRLAGTTKGLVLCAENPNLRNLLVANHLTDIMAALLQLSFAPLKKPTDVTADPEITLTPTLYDKVMKDRDKFNSDLNSLMKNSHKPLIMRELMMFYGNKCEPANPSWLRRAVFKVLNCKLQEVDGVESIVRAVIDAANYDTGVEWKQLDVIVRLFMTKPNAADADFYYANICQQVLRLLDEKNARGECIPQFETVVAMSVKYLYEIDQRTCCDKFVKHLLRPFDNFTRNDSLRYKAIGVLLPQRIKMLHYCFMPAICCNSPPLPVKLLVPIAKVLFYMLVVVSKSTIKTSKMQLQDVVARTLNDSDAKFRNKLFETLLFDVRVPEVLDMRKDYEIYVDVDEIGVKPTEYKTSTSSQENSDCICELLENDEKLSLPLFVFLLEMLSTADDSPEPKANKELLHLEEDFVLDESVQRKLITLQLLSTLAENARIKNHLAKQPEEVFAFIETVLDTSISKNVHKIGDLESPAFSTLFVTVMILQATVNDSQKIDLQTFPTLRRHLATIRDECKNTELAVLIGTLLTVERSSDGGTSSSTTDVDKAIEDVCDALLPVRAHGLMTLAKLIEKKDPVAASRKQYLLNLFQQNVKNDDSYIYLSAINGLAALGDTFTETVLTSLCEEYADFTQRGAECNNEVRMKVGEVLVRVVRTLGDVAPKYKPLLLNTFLAGCKDDDHLMRASSLSNLGEICRVLGYKLGTIITEVLVCVHAIIATDKAIEARRAAVTVIRQLFVGLESEMIAFLKEDILPIYRTLKNVYNNDPDDTMRLQAQLALEQLNENMKEFVFPKLNLEKRVVMPS